MKLTQAARLQVMLLSIALGVAFFVGNQPQVSALTIEPGLGSRIVCLVFTRLDAIGEPIPHMLPDGCAQAPRLGATLKVVKQVSGGAAAASDFSIHIKFGGVEVGGSPQPGDSNGTSYIGLPTGSYTVGETGGPGDYGAAFSGDCSTSGAVELADGDNKTCTITNTFQQTPVNPENTLALCTDGSDNDGDSLADLTDPDCSAYAPKLTIVKRTKDITGAVGLSATFTFSLRTPAGPQIASASVTTESGYGTSSPITLPIGASKLTEDGKFGWNLTELSCTSTGAGISTSVPGGAEIIAHAGDTVTCTFTNSINGSNGGVGGGGSTLDLSITKSVSTTGPKNGDTVTYTLVATNTGSASAGLVKVSDMLPNGLVFVSSDAATIGTTYASSTGLWDIGTLRSGSSTVLHIVATVTASAGQQVVNTATLDWSGDPNTQNNTGSATISVTGGSTQCSDGTDNDDDNRIDSNDPSCHTDFNPFNANSFDGSRNNESAKGTTQCADGVDNDSDGNVDWADSGCHSDFNASNNASYDPSRNDERAAAPTSGGGGGGGSGGGTITGLITSASTTSVSSTPTSASSTTPTALSVSGEVLGLSTSTPESCDRFLTAFIKTGQMNNPQQVKRLQVVLHDFEQAEIEISGLYDAATLAAVNEFQAKYASEILTPWGISAPTGHVYYTTRKKVNEIYCRNMKQFPLTTEQLQEIVRYRTGPNALATPQAPAAPGTRGTVITPTPQGAPIRIESKFDIAPSIRKLPAGAASSAPDDGRALWSFLDVLRRVVPW